MNKLPDRWNHLSAPAKASIWFVICSFFQKGVSFITVPIFTRLLTTEQYGVFSVYNSWYSILVIFATLNLTAGVYNNCLVKFPEDRKVVTSSFQGLSTTVTGILFVVYLASMDFWNSVFELSTLFVVVMFAEFVFIPAYSFWCIEQRFDYKYIGIVIITIVIAVGSPIVGIIAVLSTSYRAEARVISYALVQVIVGMFFYVYNFRRGKKFFSKEYWIFAIKFNLPLIPHYLSMTVLNQADRIMISQMVSNSAAAIYSVAYSVATIMNMVTTSINSSLCPYTYKALKDGDYRGIRKTGSLLLILVAGMSIIVMAFGPEVVLIVGGEEYYDAIWVLPPIAAAVYFEFLYPLFANIEFYYEKNIGIMIASCLGAIANVILNYIFINIYGYYAAGYTTLVCYIIFGFAHYFMQKKIIVKELGMAQNIYDMKIVVLLSIFEVIAMVGMTLTYNFIALRYSILVILFVVAFINRGKITTTLRAIKAR